MAVAHRKENESRFPQPTQPLDQHSSSVKYSKPRKSLSQISAGGPRPRSCDSHPALSSRKALLANQSAIFFSLQGVMVSTYLHNTSVCGRPGLADEEIGAERIEGRSPQVTEQVHTECTTMVPNFHWVPRLPALCSIILCIDLESPSWSLSCETHSQRGSRGGGTAQQGRASAAHGEPFFTLTPPQARSSLSLTQLSYLAPGWRVPLEWKVKRLSKFDIQ